MDIFLATSKIFFTDLFLQVETAIAIEALVRGLPTLKRRKNVLLGILVGTILRLVPVFFTISALNSPRFQFVGGILLVGVCWKLSSSKKEEDTKQEAKSGIVKVFMIIKTFLKKILSFDNIIMKIIIIIFITSLDNLLAVTKAANGNIWLVGGGMVLTIPMLILFIEFMDRFLKPRLVNIVTLGGVALLAYIAGEMMLDPMVHHHVITLPKMLTISTPVGFAIAMTMVSWWRIQRRNTDKKLHS